MIGLPNKKVDNKTKKATNSSKKKTQIAENSKKQIKSQKTAVSSPEKNNKKKRGLRLAALLGLFVLAFSTSYALFRMTLNGTMKNLLSSGSMELSLLDENGMQIYSTDDSYKNSNVYGVSLDNAVPITDEEGEETVATKFSLKSRGSVDTAYSISLEDLPLPSGEERLDDKYVKYTLTVNYNGEYERYDGDILLSMLNDREIDSGIIKPNEQYDYILRIWVDKSAEGDLDSMGKLFLTHLKVDASQVTKDTLGNIDQKYMYTSNYGHILSTLRQDGTFKIDNDDYATARSVNYFLLLDDYGMYYVKRALAASGVDTTNLDTHKKIKAALDNFEETASSDEYNHLKTTFSKEFLYDYLTKLGFNFSKDTVISKYEEIIDEVGNYDDYVDLSDNIIRASAASSIYDLSDLRAAQLISKYIYNNTKPYVSSVPYELLEVKIVPGVTIIRNLNSSCISEIDIPEGVTSLSASALKSNTRLTKVSLPNTLTTIGQNAFNGDTNVGEITIPNSVTSVKSYAFRYWTSEQKIHIDNSEDNISGWASGWKTNCNAQIDYLR